MSETKQQFTGHCMKCKQAQEIVGVLKETRNGQPMLQGECTACGTKVSKFVKRTPVVE